MTLSNIRNLPTRWSWGKPRLPKDKLDSSAPQAWITEVRARKRISEVIDELPLGNILHVKLNLHAYSFFLEDFPLSGEIKHTPRLYSAALSGQLLFKVICDMKVGAQTPTY